MINWNQSCCSKIKFNAVTRMDAVFPQIAFGFRLKWKLLKFWWKFHNKTERKTLTSQSLKIIYDKRCKCSCFTVFHKKWPFFNDMLRFFSIKSPSFFSVQLIIHNDGVFLLIIIASTKHSTLNYYHKNMTFAREIKCFLFQLGDLFFIKLIFLLNKKKWSDEVFSS